MKAWIAVPFDRYDDELHICHAETRDKARSALANEIGCDFIDVDVERWPAMDDLPLTDFNLLATLSSSRVGCLGCHRDILSDVDDGIFWYYDGEDWQDHDECQMAYHVEGVGMFCTKECADRARCPKCRKLMYGLKDGIEPTCERLYCVPCERSVSA